jgi:hypothetical protein
LAERAGGLDEGHLAGISANGIVEVLAIRMRW